MTLVFLYGPPAVGKLTVALKLQKKLGYKLLHNHLLISLFDSLFDFSDPVRIRLTREFRLRIVEEMSKKNTDLIITSGTAGNKDVFNYFSKLINLVDNNGGNLAMVQLTADKESLLLRVEDQFRKGHGKNFGRKELRDILIQPKLVFDKYPDLEHLTIDTRNFSPEESALKIMEYYHLS